MTIREFKQTNPHQASDLKPNTLVFLRRQGEVLLAMKKRGFGAGRWNGVGGKLEAGENVEQAARREAHEEIGVTLGSIRQVADLLFHEAPRPGHVPMQSIAGTVYECWDWTGEPSESEEMAPAWYRTGALPFDEMWPDDPHWLPLVLQGQYVRGEFLFGPDDRVLDMSIAARHD
jgi:8-oxo-dGTP pyrophosphatase MutT (NUDIX family)